MTTLHFLYLSTGAPLASTFTVFCSNVTFFCRYKGTKITEVRSSKQAAGSDAVKLLLCGKSVFFFTENSSKALDILMQCSYTRIIPIKFASRASEKGKPIRHCSLEISRKLQIKLVGIFIRKIYPPLLKVPAGRNSRDKRA